MTRKDYETIAACFRGAMDDWQRDANTPEQIKTAQLTLWDVADRLALELELDNPRFDRERFLKACGVED